MKKLRIKYPCIVEGKYDKIKLDSILEGRIIDTCGFGIFSDREKKEMFIALSKKTPLIIATDSDGAGLVIRNYMKSIIPPHRLFHVYIPEIKGKEKRKSEPSRAGTLGVEGMDSNLLRDLFLPYADSDDAPMQKSAITKTDLYLMGLSGTDNSAEKRKELCKLLSLPTNISSAAFLDAVNMLYDKEYIEKIVEKL
ncbi:MAG: DUF4093 domain-containing protein [Ruminococcaceae bacterium]|nr:DUF4093 domain-containing protein [Oscillospiraceae bacterium]